MINIENLPKEEVLTYLYNYANNKVPLAELQRKSELFREYMANQESWPHDPYLQFSSRDMNATQAAIIIEKYQRQGSLRFMQLYSRKLFVDISGDTFNPAHYDRFNGEGRAKAAIKKLRSDLGIPKPEHRSPLRSGWFDLYSALEESRPSNKGSRQNQP